MEFLKTNFGMCCQGFLLAWAIKMNAFWEEHYDYVNDIILNIIRRIIPSSQIRWCKGMSGVLTTYTIVSIKYQFVSDDAYKLILLYHHAGKCTQIPTNKTTQLLIAPANLLIKLLSNF